MYSICIMYMLFLPIQRRRCLGREGLPESCSEARTCGSSVKSCLTSHGLPAATGLIYCPVKHGTEPGTSEEMEEAALGCSISVL